MVPCHSSLMLAIWFVQKRQVMVRAANRFVATPGALDACSRTSEEPIGFVARHAAGDWGDLDVDDKRENERSLEDGNRLL
jgi:hypothetical protein